MTTPKRNPSLLAMTLVGILAGSLLAPSLPALAGPTSALLCGYLKCKNIILNGTTLTPTGAEINVLHGVTAGTVAASKAVVVDSSKNVTGFNNVTVGGITTPTGGVAAAGGFTVSPRLFMTGGKPAASSTDGTDTAFVTTQTQWAEVFVPSNATVTGVSWLDGSATAGAVVVALANSAGAIVDNSATAGTSIGNTANTYVRVAFTAPYAAVGPATYYIGLQGNNTGGKFRAHAFGDFVATQQTGQTFGTLATLAPGATFNANQGPIASLY